MLVHFIDRNDRKSMTSYLQVHRLIAIVALLLSAALNAQVEITDSHGKYHFSEPPKRFVALNWALAEQLIALDEIPLGIAGLDQFQRLGSRLPLLDGVQDLGPRLTPDLQKIRNLKPEIIFIGYSQRSLLRPLSNIATVVYFKNFGRRYDNARKSEERLLELAKLFEKTELAEQLIVQRDNAVEQSKQELNSAFVDTILPKVMMVVPAGEGKRLHGLFGSNSMPFAAAGSLGLDVITTEKTDKFGAAQVSSSELSELFRQNADKTKAPACIIEFANYLPDLVESQQKLINMKEAGCYLSVDYQQAFGGVMSLQWLAESIAKSLIEFKSTDLPNSR